MVLCHFICLNANCVNIVKHGLQVWVAEGASPGGGHMAGVLLVRVASGQWSRVLIGAEHGAMLIHATLHSGHTTGHWQQHQFIHE